MSKDEEKLIEALGKAVLEYEDPAMATGGRVLGLVMTLGDMGFIWNGSQFVEGELENFKFRPNFKKYAK